MNSLNLTQQEICETTGKVRYSAQCKALRSMGIDVKRRPDGRPIVSRSHYEKVMGGIINDKIDDIQLNFDNHVA